MMPGSVCRPKYTPRRDHETPRGNGRREEYEGHEGKGKECQFADVSEI
jgi:hypothetical protein